MYCGSRGKGLRMAKRTIGYMLLGVGIALGACSQNFSEKEPVIAMAERGFKPLAGAAVQKNEQQTLGPFSGVAPEGWLVQKPSSSMRLAQFGLPGSAGEATLGIFYFGPGQGGGIEANIERWYGQFTQQDGSSTKERARRWSKKVGDIEVSMVDISGTFSGGMGSAEAKEGYRMLGAIASHRTGAVFFKLTGPVGTVARWQQSFDQYLDSLTARDDEI